jgi:hypothetical protein
LLVLADRVGCHFDLRDDNSIGQTSWGIGGVMAV